MNTAFLYHLLTITTALTAAGCGNDHAKDTKPPTTISLSINTHDIPATTLGNNQGISAKIDGKIKTITGNYSKDSGIHNGQIYLQITDQQGNSWLIDVPARAGTHFCFPNGPDGERTRYRYSNANNHNRSQTTTWSSRTGDTCTVDIEQPDNETFSGIFAGTLHTSDHVVLVTDGHFKATLKAAR